MQTRFVRALAVPAAGALVALAAAPGFADVTDGGDLANASAGAVIIQGDSVTGRYVVENDGPTTGDETSSGTNEPALDVLSGTSLAQVGTLAQDARTEIIDGDGYSWACAGTAGDGATLVEVGDGSCLSGGDNVRLDAGALDLTNLTVIESAELEAALQPILEGADPILDAFNDQILTAIADNAATVGEALGEPGLYVDLGAINSWCEADPTQASGDSSLVGAGAFAEIDGEQIPILNLPVSPEPNTHLVTDLSAVVDAIVDGVQTQLNTTLTETLDPANLGILLNNDSTLGEVAAALGLDLPAELDAVTDQSIESILGDPVLGPLLEDEYPDLQEQMDTFNAELQAALDEIQTQLETNLLNELESGLAPVEENVLDVTLNAQHDENGAEVTYTTDDAIHVTALDLKLLPAAGDFGFDGLNLQIGDVTCGPNGRVGGQTAGPTVGPTAGQADDGLVGGTGATAGPTALPTSVPAGVESAGGLGTAGSLAAGGLLVLAMGAGAVAYRRSLG